MKMKCYFKMIIIMMIVISIIVVMIGVVMIVVLGVLCKFCIFFVWNINEKLYWRCFIDFVLIKINIYYMVYSVLNLYILIFCFNIFFGIDIVSDL